MTGADLDKSSRFTDWSRRPLSQKQLAYALGDVTHLREVYRHLKDELRSPGGRRLARRGDGDADRSRAPTTLKPEDAWRRLKLRVKNRKALAVLIELAAWRERLAQSQDVPRAASCATRRSTTSPTRCRPTPAAAGELRTLSEGFCALGARPSEIVEAVKRGLARDPKTVPPIPHGHAAADAEAGATVELLRVLLKAAAARHGWRRG